MPFAHVTDAMVIKPVTIRIQDLLSAVVLPSVVVPAGIDIGDNQQVVHDSRTGSLPPADQYAADFFRARFDRVPTREG